MSKESNHDDIIRAIGRLEGKQDSALTILEKFDNRITENEKQINNVKTKLAWYTGAGSAIGFIIGKFTDMFHF